MYYDELEEEKEQLESPHCNRSHGASSITIISSHFHGVQHLQFDQLLQLIF